MTEPAMIDYTSNARVGM